MTKTHKSRNVTQIFLKRRLPLVAFGTGFGLLAFELVAARILAPHIGSSTYVWTSVIGVIIAALALGYLVGGRVADARKRLGDVAWLLLISGAAIVYTLCVYDTLLPAIAELAIDTRLQGVLAALVLFAPASFCIGTISPYLAKLNVKSLHTTGRAIASLDMHNSLGGIAGTFVTGFILFGFVGLRDALVGFVLLFVLMSWWFVPRHHMVVRIIASVVMLSLALLPPLMRTNAIATIDTPTAHYEIVPVSTEEGELTGLVMGPGGIQSGVYADGRNDLAFWYTQEMARLTIVEAPTRVLMLGGGAFTLPEYLAHKLPNATIDAVEIDPALHGISVQYFGYTNPSNVRLHFEDARTFVQRTTEQYDVILIDVYGDAEIPYSLMTREFGDAVAQRLAPNGRVVANVASGTTGACGEILQSVHAAYATQLQSVQHRLQPGRTHRGNVIALYDNRSQQEPNYTQVSRASHSAPYADNYVPAERLYYACSSSRN